MAHSSGERLGHEVENDEGPEGPEQGGPGLARVGACEPHREREERSQPAREVEEELAPGHADREQRGIDEEEEPEEDPEARAVTGDGGEVDGEEERHHGAEEGRVL